MKKLSLLLIVALFALTNCGSDDENATITTKIPVTFSEDYNVIIEQGAGVEIQLSETFSLDDDDVSFDDFDGLKDFEVTGITYTISDLENEELTIEGEITIMLSSASFPGGIELVSLPRAELGSYLGTTSINLTNDQLNLLKDDIYNLNPVTVTASATVYDVPVDFDVTFEITGNAIVGL